MLASSPESSTVVALTVLAAASGGAADDGWIQDTIRKSDLVPAACSGPTGTVMGASSSEVPNPYAVLDPVSFEIEGLGALRANWDGYGGTAPTKAARLDARRVVAMLPNNKPAPSVEPSGDGEISLVWRSPISHLEIGVYGDGLASIFGEGGGKPVVLDCAIAELPWRLPEVEHLMANGRLRV